MINEILRSVNELVYATVRTLKIKDNSDKLKKRIDRLQSVFMSDNLLKLMFAVGNDLKKHVLNKANWTSSYDLKDYGQLLNYLQQEQPTVYVAGNVVGVGYGNIAQLNQIKRPADTAKLVIKRGDGYYEKEVTLKAGEFPYWIAAEFGILARGETPPAKFGLPPKKTTTEYSPLRLASLKPSGKPHFMMIYSKKRKPHPGVYPTRLFRRGLWVLYNQRAIEVRLAKAVRQALGGR